MQMISTDLTIQFEEGLIGFYDCKSFVLIEREEIAPFRWLQSIDRSDIGFLVIDPSLVVTDYSAIIPYREWDSLGVRDPYAGLVLVTCMIGTSNAESTGNLQAPLLVNCQKRVGKQVILTETGLTSRHPLL
jgi:flagellar assembly factor FliW